MELLLEKYDESLSDAEKEMLIEQKNEYYKESLTGISPADLSADTMQTLEAVREKGIFWRSDARQKTRDLFCSRSVWGLFSMQCQTETE